jgi:Na+/proline symporter
MLESFSLPTILAILAVYFLVMFGLTKRFSANTGAEEFVVANRNVNYGWGSASMSSTWIWAASMYAAATAAFTYGVSGAFHYAFWGGLGLLFVWAYGRRVRQLAPYGHTLPEFIRARHGRLSQGVIGLENYLNAQYSLIVNFTAAAALLSLFSPLSQLAALLLTAAIVLGYSLLTGIRASLSTDLVQIAAMVVIAAIAVPVIFFNAGGPSGFADSLATLDAGEANFFSLQGFLGQGAPMMALVLAYAFANATVWQRIWVVSERKLKSTYITSGLMYMALVFGVGTLGFIALTQGLSPVDGSTNNIVPQVANQFLPPALALGFVVLLIGAITSTSDSDLSALSSIAMADVWRSAVRPQASEAELKLVGRVVMIGATTIAVAVALPDPDILNLILFFGAIRAASVFPIAASIVWRRVSNAAFSTAIVVGIALAILADRGASTGDNAISFLSANLWLGAVFIVFSSVGAGVMAGCLAYPFLRIRISTVAGAVVSIAVLVTQMVALPGLLTYASILSALTALGVGMLVCVGVTLMTDNEFDWDQLEGQFTPFDRTETAPS